MIISTVAGVILKKLPLGYICTPPDRLRVKKAYELAVVLRLLHHKPIENHVRTFDLSSNCTERSRFLPVVAVAFPVPWLLLTL